VGLLEPFSLFGAFDRKMRPIFSFDRPSFLLKQDKEGRQTAKVTVKLTLTHNLIPEQFTVKAQRPLLVRLCVCLCVCVSVCLSVCVQDGGMEAAIFISFFPLIHFILLFLFLLFYLLLFIYLIMTWFYFPLF